MMNKNNYKKFYLFIVIFFISIIYSTINKNVTYSVVNKKNKESLEGSWTWEGSVKYCRSELKIFNQTKKYFDFEIFSTCGSHVGELKGRAKIISNNMAHSVIKDPDYPCEVYFRKIRNNKIKVKTTNNDCQGFRGVAVGFKGIYIKNLRIKEKTLRDYLNYIFENEKELIAFQKLIGPNYEKLFTDLFYSTSEDKELNARVYTGSVTGFFNVIESIIIINSPNRIWAAAIDNEVVRYFTNVPDYYSRLPKTIEEWRKGFLEKPVIFMNTH